MPETSTVAEADTGTDTGADTGTTTAADPAVRAPARRRLTRRTKICTALILVLALLEGSGLAMRYVLVDHRFVVADNAMVDGDAIEIHAPADGLVVGWTVDTGSSVAPGQVLGRVEVIGDASRPRKAVRSPGRGTIVQNTVSNGMHVSAGALLATAYDLTGIYVTARIREENIAGVHVGAPVDVMADAAPDVPLTATVSVIGATSAGVNQLSNSPSDDPLNLQYPIYPGNDTDPQNPQAVQQYIPVKILFTGTGGARISPGESVTVHIHRQ